MNRPFPIPPTPSAIRGMDFVKAAISMGVAGGKGEAARNIAAQRYGEDSGAFRFLKAAVGAIESGDVNSTTNNAAAEFMSAVFAQTVVGKLSGLRRRPINTRYLINNGPMTGHWVAEGDAIPILPLSFEQATLDLLKVASISVFTDETLKIADPVVEAGIRQDMIDGLVEAIDRAFVDPGNAGVAGQEPASISNGLTPVSVGTGDLDDVRAAISTMIDEFQGDLGRAVFIGSPQLFAMLNGQGFRDIGLRGGELVGAPAIPTKGLGVSGGRYVLLLVDPSGIAYADDPNRASIVASRNAAIEMADNPSGDATTPTPRNLVSLFQTNATALRALAYANWEVEQAGAVSMGLMFPEAAVS